MTETRAIHPEILAAEQVAALITIPTVNQSIAGAVANVVNITGPSLRIPLLTTLPTAAVIAEGAEYPLSTMDFGEVKVEPQKIGVADTITRELANDSNPAAQQLFASGLAASLATRVDGGFIGTDPVTDMPGLEQITPTVITAGTAWSSLDPLIDAQANAESHGTIVDTWLMHPTTKTALRKIKVTAGSVQALLTPDTASSNVTSVLGTQIVTTTQCPQALIYGIPRNRTHLVVREAAEVLTDKSLFFLSDRIAIKASVRIGWTFTDPAAIARIKLTA